MSSYHILLRGDDNVNMYEKALKKIKEDEKCKPNFCCYPITGATGATGPTGPTG